MNQFKFIVIIFLIWRILLFIPLYIGNTTLDYRSGYEYTNIWKFVKSYQPVDISLIYPWANFDGVHYLSIANNGYQQNARFFPLYPALIKFFSFGQPTFSTVAFFAGLAISNIAFVAGLILLYKLLILDYKNNVVITTIIVILLFPTSFFFASLYTESLFLLFAVLSFYWARQKRWFLTFLAASLLVLTRPVGIAILPALFFEFLKAKDNPKKTVFFLLPIVSLCGFFFFNAFAFGNPFQFLINQREIANSRELFIFPAQTVFRYLNILITLPTTQFEWGLALLELVTFFVVSLLLFFAWKKKVRASYLIFALVCFLIPVFSGTFSGLPRYSLVLFPIFITLALIKNRAIKILYAIISPVLLFILLMLFSRGYFIS